MSEAESSLDRIGRYTVLRQVGTGGYATVLCARLEGEGGFARVVAIKRLLPHLADEPAIASMFLDEARIASRIRHPNVVSVLDVVEEGGELYLVMDFVRGEPLSELLARCDGPVPERIAVGIASQLLRGLHAAHEAKGEEGAPLEVVHRDVSPQNVLVGEDGTARVTDFGIAKAVGRSQSTGDGRVKGKVRYMAPEQVRAEVLDRRADVYAAGVVVWEMLAGRAMFSGEAATVLYEVLKGAASPPGAGVLDPIVMRALALDPAERYPTALDFAVALEAAEKPASADEIAVWARGLPESEAAAERRLLSAMLAEIEATAPYPHAPPGRSIETGAAVVSDRSGARAATVGATTALSSRRRIAAVAGALGVVAAITIGAFALRKSRDHGGADAKSSTTETVTAPSPPACPTCCVKKIFSGADVDSTCAVRADGKLYCWGDNARGVLREKGEKGIPKPTLVEAVIDPSDLALTRMFAFAVVQGKLAGWGTDMFGVLRTGREGERGRLAVDMRVDAISARGDLPSICVVQEGKVSCWGSTQTGQAGLGPENVMTGDPQPIALPIGEAVEVEHVGNGGVCARGAAGAWSCWGNMTPWVQEISIRRKNPRDPSAGFETSYTVGKPDARAGAEAIAGGGLGGCLLSAGKIRCWGSDRLCQVRPDGSGPDIAAPEDRSVPAPLASGVRAIASGFAHHCAIAGDGDVYCWGATDSGQAGAAGGRDDARVCDPIRIPLPRPAKMLALGARHTCVLTDDGAVSCFGANAAGQLGRGSMTNGEAAPAPVAMVCGD